MSTIYDTYYESCILSRQEIKGNDTGDKEAESPEYSVI